MLGTQHVGGVCDGPLWFVLCSRLGTDQLPVDETWCNRDPLSLTRSLWLFQDRACDVLAA